MTSKLTVFLLAMMCVSNVGLHAWEENLVPVPRSITLGQENLPLGSRIVAATPELRPLAEVVAEEIMRLTGRTLSVVEGGTSQPGDIWLELTPAREGSTPMGLNEDQSYVLAVTDIARVSGGSYVAVAYGTVTLLQSLSEESGGLVLPRYVVSDEPAHAYRGLMIDVARKPHSIATLKHLIQLCRWYKIRYLHLHLTDDESFTFPSTAFPQLATPGASFTLDELRGLEAFAAERGVVIVPEFDVPGHAGALVNAMPELFAVEGGALSGWSVTMNFAKEEAVLAVETIIGEMLDVFQSTPFFHIGADEANFAGFDEDPFFQQAYQELGITADLGETPADRTVADYPNNWIKFEEHPRAYELFLRFVVRLNDKIKSLDRQTIMWEGFSPAGITRVPTDVIVMPYHMRNYNPEWLAEDGYSLINTSAEPLYVVSGWQKPELEVIYQWNPRHFDWRQTAWTTPMVAPALGAQMCSWAQADSEEMPTLRKRLAVMSQRLWNPDSGEGFAAFSTRLDQTDAKLSELMLVVDAGPDRTVPFGTSAPPGWSFAPWTGDADSNISSSHSYTAKHSFGNNRSTTTANGVTLAESFATSGTGWSIGGATSWWDGDDDAAVTGDSELLAQEFVFNGTPRSVTMSGLTVGQTYEANFYSVEWSNFPRIQTFSTPGTTPASIDQSLYGDNKGIRIFCSYTATAPSQTFTISPESASTFHLYAMTNRLLPPADSTADSASVNLDGTVSDPGGDPLTTSWSMQSGPAAVSFAHPSAVDTLATFTEPGVYVLRLTVGDGINSTSDDVTVTITDDSIYKAWTQSTFANDFNGSDLAADPDGDGYNNLLEFAFGMDPTVGMLRPLGYQPDGDVSNPGNPVLLEDSVESGFNAVFGRRKDHQVAGLRYTCEFSADLVAWTASAATPLVLTGATGGGDIEAVSVRYPASVPLQAGGTQAPQFFRVKVEWMGGESVAN